jgi:hypothetical protein
MQVILLQANILEKFKALQEQGITPFYFMLNGPTQVFYFTSFI